MFAKVLELERSPPGLIEMSRGNVDHAVRRNRECGL